MGRDRPSGMSRRLTLAVVWSLLAAGALVAGPTGILDLPAPVEASPRHAATTPGSADPAALAEMTGSRVAGTASSGPGPGSGRDAGSVVLGAILLAVVLLAAGLLVSVRRRSPANERPGDRDETGLRAAGQTGSSGDPLLAALRASGGLRRTSTDPRPAPRWVLHLAEVTEMAPGVPEEAIASGGPDDEPIGSRTGVA